MATSFGTALAAARPKGPIGTQRSSIIPELSGAGAGLPGHSHFLPQERELNDLWIGRQRTETVEDMLNHWQVAALRQAVRLPVHRYIIELDPQDCDPATADLVGVDLDVPLVGRSEKRTGRRAKRFSARRHLDRALDALDYGHAVFEHAGYLDPQTGWWRLKNLPPVPQWTIHDQNSWEPDQHGNLLRVIQWGANPPVKLDVDRLVVCTWQGRPGDPRGRSMLRPLTFAWQQSVRTAKVMGFSAERTGMGIPVGGVSDSAVAGAKEQMERLLAGLAAGESTNLVLPGVQDVRKAIMLMGVSGSTPDLVGHVKYWDEAMARTMLAMVIQLGQTDTGSRALGGTFDDLLADFHDAILGWYCDVMTEQLVEPWIDRNLGEDAPAPRLVWRRREDDTGDEDEADEPIIDATVVEGEQPQLPAPVSARRAAARKSDTAAAGTRITPATLARRQSAVRAAFATVAGRDLRRDLTEIELAAATDFATIETQFVTTRANIAAALIALRDQLTAVAVEQVAAMEQVDPLTLGDVLAPVLEQHAADMDHGALVALLVAFAAGGVHQVIGEAARQGVALEADVDYAERAEADAADLVRRMARQVADSTASAARTGLAPGVNGQPAANVVADHLGSLTSAAAEQAAAGAASRAQNAGRAAAIGVGPILSVHASEVLDAGTCGPCLLADGREYGTLAAALAEYPAGGYVACEGMERCRGLLLALFDPDR